jgi:hypothetical protein
VPIKRKFKAHFGGITHTLSVPVYHFALGTLGGSSFFHRQFVRGHYASEIFRALLGDDLALARVATELKFSSHQRVAISTCRVAGEGGIIPDVVGALHFGFARELRLRAGQSN